MSRYRLLPTPAQQAVLRDHCGHARYIWNLAVEQHSHWHPSSGCPTPLAEISDYLAFIALATIGLQVVRTQPQHLAPTHGLAEAIPTAS